MNFAGAQRRRGKDREVSDHAHGPITQLRQTFLDAQDYAMTKSDIAKLDKVAAGDKKDDKRPSVDLKMEALLPYLKGERPVVIGVYEGYDVEVTMQIAQEFHLKVILNHVTHTQEILDKIASYKVPVIVGSIYAFPAPMSATTRSIRCPRSSRSAA